MKINLSYRSFSFNVEIIYVDPFDFVSDSSRSVDVVIAYLVWINKCLIIKYPITLKNMSYIEIFMEFYSNIVKQE